MSRNATVAFLRDLRLHHVSLEAREDRLKIRAPQGAVSDGDRAALRELKPAILERLRQEQHLLGLSLDEFAAQGVSIEIAIPGLEETIWFVPSVEHVDDLTNDGVHRGRIWTTAELRDLLAIPGLTEQDLVSLGRLKLEFGGELLSFVTDQRHAQRQGSGASERTKCRACGKTRFWVSTYGATVCAKCHPPASPNLVVRWIDRDEEASS